MTIGFIIQRSLVVFCFSYLPRNSGKIFAPSVRFPVSKLPEAPRKRLRP